MSDSTIAKMIKELKDKIEELEQQLAEQVAYGEQINQRDLADFMFQAPMGDMEGRANRLLNKYSITKKPSQDLVNKMKAKAVREAVKNIGVFNILTPSAVHGNLMLSTDLLDYAKQLEGGE